MVENPCATPQLPMYLMNVHLFFAKLKRERLVELEYINTYSSGS